MDSSLKARTAGTLKWNVIDRLASQVLYAVTGIILARLLSQEDFGLVGAILVFQAFATLLVDSGFSYALLQRKQPSETDYSTVLWFNLAISVLLYMVLWFLAPTIAAWFGGDARLVPLSRVMFLSFILNASSIVQVNRLMKKMDVRMVTVSNALGLSAGAVAGIWLALSGYGAWAIVWQSLANYGIKSIVLWVSQRWMPQFSFSFRSLKSFFGIGGRMMFTSFLNTLFINIYAFVIGNRAGLAPLGYYSQSDKWSKMGIMSLSQILTSSFLPALAAVQDDQERFVRVASKMNRFTAYLLFPFIIGLIVMATPIFHLLFGTKWDPSILLFQILLLRGIFTVLVGYYNNILLALGHARAIMWLEVFRDSIALIALVAALPYVSESRPDDPVWGLTLLLWGQLIASALTWIATLAFTGKLCHISAKTLLNGLLPYLTLSIVIGALIWFVGVFDFHPAVTLLIQVVVSMSLYLGINHMMGSVIQNDVLSHFFKGIKKN